MLVTLYCIVEGPIYERYFEQLHADALQHFLPGECEIVALPGRRGNGGPDWSHISSTRYRVALEHADRLHGEHLFQIDADMRIVRPVEPAILVDGIVVTMHPGYPEGYAADLLPYERRPESRAFVPYGVGARYHPGAFVGGEREAFFEMALFLADRIDADIAAGTRAVWYEESYLNRWLIDHPPALVLDERYCGWQEHTVTPETIIYHLNKTREEFDARG